MRWLKTGTVIRRPVYLAIAILLMAYPMASAQSTPESDTASPENLEEFLDQEGLDWTLWTVEGYEFQGLSFNDPMLFVFGAIRLATSAEAVHAFDAIPGFIETTLVNSMSETGESPNNFRSVSVDRIGDEAKASGATMEMGAIGIVYVRRAQYVLFGITATVFGNVIQTLTPYLEHTVKRLDQRAPRTWQQLQNLLPSLGDLPPGYAEWE